MTDKQIRDLRNEALAAQDYTQADICLIALGHSIHRIERDVVVYRLGSASRNTCRAECARVIEDAKAQR